LKRESGLPKAKIENFLKVLENKIKEAESAIKDGSTLLQ